MRLLIVGGTIFLGRHLVEAAIARRHGVTIFNRGRHNPDLYPEIEKLRGDRTGDLSALGGRRFDAVIDTCGYVPSDVRRTAGLLRDAAAHYTFISSVSVYASFDPAGTGEEAPISEISRDQVIEAEGIPAGDRATAPIYAELYGALKGLCEKAAEEAMPGRVLNVRPGLIAGPHDPSDRFTYWVRRVADGGRVLAPGKPDRRVRVIDARDLAEWIVLMVERGQTGIYNATGAEDHLTMKGMLETCRAVSSSDARFVWTAERWLLDRNVTPWSELPLWVPEALNGIFAVRNDNAISAGLTFRPIADTIRDTLAWDARRPRDAALRAGLKSEREQELLKTAHE
ncbi:MAG TPA: NAD-dependent epimerase/dehydratase family protein [Vicinamibacterales bacterium]|jgi:2'-hydroxyisoflavone reductase|nr:NAD-dependent epimerase/dehydratase family protein [Vicinamibacterales bacterium]